MRLPIFVLITLLPFFASAESLAVYSQSVAHLIEPAKLATLGKRGANPRVQKAVALLETARLDGHAVAVVASNAVFIANYTNKILATLTFDSLTRNHGIATKLGTLSDEGLSLMRRGKSPTVQLGPYRNDILTVDHIVPFAVAPELDLVIANLELMPRRLNSSKGAKLGARQFDYARRFHSVGLISDYRLDQITGG